MESRGAGGSSLRLYCGLLFCRSLALSLSLSLSLSSYPSLSLSEVGKRSVCNPPEFDNQQPFPSHPAEQPNCVLGHFLVCASGWLVKDLGKRFAAMGMRFVEMLPLACDFKFGSGFVMGNLPVPVWDAPHS